MHNTTGNKVEGLLHKSTFSMIFSGEKLVILPPKDVSQFIRYKTGNKINYMHLQFRI